YSTVTQLTESWFFIAVAIATSVFPAIMNFRKNQPEIYQKRMTNLYDLMVVVSVSIALTITFGAPYFYTLLKPEFISGASALQVSAWGGVFAFLGAVSGQYHIAEGLTKIRLALTMIGAIAIVILSLIFITTYGIMGAAYANLLAQAIATLSNLFFPRTRKQG